MIDLSIMDNPNENIFVLKKWDWNYLEAEKFQLECVDYVHKNPHVSILIICSHTHCFTLGRGLQKIKESAPIELVDFDPKNEMIFPLYQVKRGGGLTFHYPGQVVFYPILNLTEHKKNVFDVMWTILEITKDLLEKQFNFRDLETKRDLLGLWFSNELTKVKIASIGLALQHFNTYHGLALNFFYDQDLFHALKTLYPCGLPGDTYRDLESLLGKKISLNEREQFSENFLSCFSRYLIP